MLYLFMQVGLLAGNIGFIRRIFEKFNKTFGFIIDLGMILYMFALGIEMDPYVLFRKPTRDVQIAYAAMISTFIFSSLAATVLNYFPRDHKVEFTLALSTLISGTASPVLTRMMTNLKIGKSDIGKLVIAAGMHSDLMCSLIMSFGNLFVPLHLFCSTNNVAKSLKGNIATSCALSFQILFTALVSPWFLNWVNNENPEGKPMKGSHLVLSIAFMALICAISPAYSYSQYLSAFMAGICLPREGRVSKWVISKINYVLTAIFFPIFFLWVGCASDFRKFESKQASTWVKLFSLIIVVIGSKVAGSVVAGAMMGFNWHESVAIGLLLAIKGHFHIYLATKVVNQSTLISWFLSLSQFLAYFGLT